MPLTVRQRSRFAVLAVLALVGSLLAVSAVPVAAEDGKADHEAIYSACVGPAMDNAGFTDMDGNFAEGAANCLAHYRITKGTSAGVFSAEDTITRLQMALFLSRAAGPAGVELPAASNQGFTDIGGMISEVQNAINQVAEMGIMEGRPGAEFAPTDNVTRLDMAVHLAAFLDHAIVGPGGTDIEDVESDDEVFTDIRDVSVHAHTAIRKLYEMGVTEGSTSTTFSPKSEVKRGQMAVFISRTLAHTNARPAGLTVQALSADVFVNDEVTLTASVRDSSHMPDSNVSVDFFRLKNGIDDPFNDAGGCRNTRVDRIGGNEDCEIDRRDDDTNPEGNIDEVSFDADGDTTVWAWTGKQGDEYDDDDTDPVTIDISADPAPANIEMTTNLPGGASVAEFGDAVVFTFQIIDSDGDPVDKKDVSVTLTAYFDRKNRETSTHKTDSSGMIERSYTEQDPDRDEDDATPLYLIVVDSDEIDVVDGDGKTPFTDNPITEAIDEVIGMMVSWDDDKAKATLLKLDTGPMYVVLPEDSGDETDSEILATVTDQYGNPIRNIDVWLSTGTVDMDNPYDSDATNSRGQATFDIVREQGTGEGEGAGAVTITARAIIGNPDIADDGGVPPDDADDPLDDLTPIGTVMFYWVDMAEMDDISNARKIVTSSTADDVIVIVIVEGTDYEVVEYDSDDNFSVEDDRDTDDGNVAVNKDLDDFEAALALIGGTKMCTGTEEVVGMLTAELRHEVDGDGKNEFAVALTCVSP